MDVKQFLSDDRGQSDSVFKLALVVIIIAAVLAVLAYVMGGAQEGATELGEGMKVASNSTNDSISKLF